MGGKKNRRAGSFDAFQQAVQPDAETIGQAHHGGEVDLSLSCLQPGDFHRRAPTEPRKVLQGKACLFAQHSDGLAQLLPRSSDSG